MEAVLRELQSFSSCLYVLKDDSANIHYPDGMQQNPIAMLKKCDSVAKYMNALLSKLF